MHQLFATNQQWKRTRSTFTFTCDSHLLSRVCKVCSRNYIVSKLTVLSFQARLDHSFKRKFRCLNAQVQKCCRQTSIPRNYFPNWFCSPAILHEIWIKSIQYFQAQPPDDFDYFSYFPYFYLNLTVYANWKKRPSLSNVQREWKLKFEPKFSLFFERENPNVSMKLYWWAFSWSVAW